MVNEYMEKSKIPPHFHKFGFEYHPMYTFVNDTFVLAADATLNVADLAIQRGYGIFDYFKTINGKPVLLNDHLDRFYHSAGRMRLDIGKSRDELKEILNQLLQRNKIPDSGIRITLTGGYPANGYSIAPPNLVITQQPLPYPITKACPPAIRIISYAHQRQLPDVKTIDYLMAIFLQPYYRDRGASDILYHLNGIITECPRSNFFLVTADDTLVTPSRNMLKGITRKKILELAPGFIKTEERDVLLSEVRSAKEAFISNTGRNVTPISHLDGKDFGASPGPVAARLNELLYALAYSQD